jgi:hypothetical protein
MHVQICLYHVPNNVATVWDHLWVFPDTVHWYRQWANDTCPDCFLQIFIWCFLQCGNCSGLSGGLPWYCPLLLTVSFLPPPKCSGSCSTVSWNLLQPFRTIYEHFWKLHLSLHGKQSFWFQQCQIMFFPIPCLALHVHSHLGAFSLLHTRRQKVMHLVSG